MTVQPRLTGLGARRLAASSDRIVVIGAGGWLGMATLELLDSLLGEAFDRRVVCFGSVPRTLALRRRTAGQQAIAGLADLPARPSLVLHLAYLTQEKANIMPHADYVAANRDISSLVLGSLDRLGAKGLFLPSSGAVYRAEDPDASASMRLYGALKRDDEAAFAAWADQNHRRAVIARVFNLSGPHIPTPSGYALGAFIADALAGRPIAIAATRPVLRSYVAIRELMSVVFGLLTDGEGGVTRFDTAGDEGLEMDAIASVVAEVFGAEHGMVRPPMGQGAPDRYIGDASVYKALRHRLAVESVDFPQQVRETAWFMAANKRGLCETH